MCFFGGIFIVLQIVFSQNFAGIVVEDHVNVIPAKDIAAAGEIIFTGISANHHRTALTQLVALTAGLPDLHQVHVAADHHIGMHIPGQQLGPLAIGILLNVKGRLAHMGEGMVGDNHTMLHAGRIVLLLCMGDNLL